MFGETRETETVLGPVIQAGMEALKVTTHINFTSTLDHLLSSCIILLLPLKITIRFVAARNFACLFL